MSKRIITISREFGSGGCFIGEEIARPLVTKASMPEESKILMSALTESMAWQMGSAR